MALNLATNPIETEDTPAILGGGAIPAAAFVPAPLPRVELDTTLRAPQVLGSAAPAPAAEPAAPGPVSILGSAAPASPLAVTSPGPLVDPALVASAQAALARSRGIASVPETTVEGTPPAPGLAGKAIPAPLAPQGGAAFDEAMRGAAKGAKAAVAAYNAENPVERYTNLLASQAGQRAKQLEGYRGQVAEAFAPQLAGAQVATEGAVKSAEEIAAATKANQERASEYAATAEENLKAAKAARDEADATRRKAEQEFSDAKIDLDKAYGDSGQRLMSAIAIGLGAFGSSLTGGPNFAMQLVNDRINRVIDAQKAEIEKKKTQAGSAAQLYRDMVNVYGDERTATDAYRAKLLDSTIAYAKARYAPQLEQGKGLEIIGRLEGEKAQALQRVDEAIQQNAQARTLIPAEQKAKQYVAGQAAAAAAAKEERAHQRAIELKRVEGSEQRATAGFKEMMESSGPKGEAAGAKEFQSALKGLGIEKPVEARASLENLRKTLDTFESEYASRASRASLSLPQWAQTEQGKEYRQAIEQSFQAYKHAVTGASATPSEMEDLRAAFGGNDPAALRRWMVQHEAVLTRAENAAAQAVPEPVREKVLNSYRGANQSSGTGGLPEYATPRGAR